MLRKQRNRATAQTVDRPKIRSRERKENLNIHLQKTLTTTQALPKLGLNIPFSNSTDHVHKKTATREAEQLTPLRQVFIQHNHQRFQKQFSPHQPYGTTEKYKAGVEKVDLDKFAKLIKICGMLLQTKVYLFWKKNAIRKKGF